MTYKQLDNAPQSVPSKQEGSATRSSKPERRYQAIYDKACDSAGEKILKFMSTLDERESQTRVEAKNQ